MVELVFDSEENIELRGENTVIQHFLLCPLCF